MVAAHDAGTLDGGDVERRFVLHGVPWATYVSLRGALDDAGSRVQMTYLAGTLELMSPSSRHEEIKKLLARLLDAWAEQLDVDLRGFGSTTFRAQAMQRGLEPDDCYVLGPMPADERPDIAIEVVVSSPLVDKLDVYAGLGVREVWTWDGARDALVIHVLRGTAYAVEIRSSLLPGVDAALLASFVRPGESHVALVKAYRAALRA